MSRRDGGCCSSVLTSTGPARNPGSRSRNYCPTARPYLARQLPEMASACGVTSLPGRRRSASQRPSQCTDRRPRNDRSGILACHNRGVDLDHQRVTPQPGWQLNQLSSAGRENLDATHVARYDAIEDAGALDEVEILQELGLSAQHVVVAIGTGTGQFALAVAPHCARVVASMYRR